MDILRHQSSPVQQGERNNTTVLTTTSDGRMSKALYTPILQSKDNRSKSAPPSGNQEPSARSSSPWIQQQGERYGVGYRGNLVCDRNLTGNFFFFFSAFLQPHTLIEALKRIFLLVLINSFPSV